MEISDFLRVPIKLWRVSVVVLVLCPIVGAGVFLAAEGEYEVDSVLVVTSSSIGPVYRADRTESQQSVRNPLLGEEFSRNYAAKLVIENLDDASQFPPLLPGVELEVTNGSDDPARAASSPFVFVKATAPEQATARLAVVARVERASRLLTERQRELGAAPETFVQVMTIVPPTSGVYAATPRLRAAIAATTLTGVLGAISIFSIASFTFRSGTESRDRVLPGDLEKQVANPRRA